MTQRSSLTALIGLWFVLAPWIMGFAGESSALWSSIIGGGVLLLSSVLGFGKSGWDSLFNWLSLLSGVWLIIFAMAFGFPVLQAAFYLLLGLAAVLLTFYNMEGR
ncbi:MULTISPECIES: SPW repeat protein [Paenibacillus]|uniref:SPW repeat protein n=1 Tax=Paenibacillus TaxID=44249 RepID=UPI0022B87375|nr:SPW repeat protein [Paenibacillus caseinilyticus]MCZ8522238.1 SPW repeat protein [Paenibacillus caseinilyticus]